MQKNIKIGSIIDSRGVVMVVVYQHRDGSIDAGDIGASRDIDDLQRVLPNGFAFRPVKDGLQTSRMLKDPSSPPTKRFAAMWPAAVLSSSKR